MKIVYIANIRFPTEKAHGIQIAKTCEAFTLLGHEVTLVVPTRKNHALAGTNPFALYGIAKRFPITWLRIVDPYWLIAFASGLYIKVESLIFMMRLSWFLRRIDQDTVLFTRDEYLLPILQRFSRRVVWEAHTLPTRLNQYQKTFNNCFRIIAITAFLKKELERLGMPADKILVAPDGVNIQQFTLSEDVSISRTALGLPTDKKIVLYSGHLYDWKGVYTLADASKNLAADALVVFVGGTATDEEKLKLYIAKNNLGNTVVTGHRPHRLIPQYLHAADVLVLPNSQKKIISSHYTSPLKLFEYMAAKKPIVASDLPSIREVLNEHNAYFAPADDAIGLATVITTVLHDVNNTQYAERAYLDVQKYSWLDRAKSIVAHLR